MDRVKFISGEVSSFTNGFGKIISNNEEYIFNNNDLENGNVKKGDKVFFRSEIINNIKHAFFIFIYCNKKEVLENDKK